MLRPRPLPSAGGGGAARTGYTRQVSARIQVELEGRTLSLSNLDKVLYPATGTTKGEIIDYYRRIAPVLLPHLADRPVTLRRFPDGVEGESFYEKNAPRHRPDWVATVALASPGSTKGRQRIDYAVICDLPTLVWAANLAAVELHVPMWRVQPERSARDSDLLVFDLDPGEGAGLVDCARVALQVNATLSRGLHCYPKTSGSKGLQLYVPLAGDQPWQAVEGYARAVAAELESRGAGVVSVMRRDLRRGKVLVDWSQNNPAKTTVSPYSLRAREEPWVSTPVSWEEVERAAGGDAEGLRFHPAQVLDRVEREGDLFAPLLAGRRRGRVPAGG